VLVFQDAWKRILGVYGSYFQNSNFILDVAVFIV
jgi:hypothetical protein